MARVPNEPSKPHESSMQASQELLVVPINKLELYFESDDTNVVILVSYEGQVVIAILDGGARISIMMWQC